MRGDHGRDPLPPAAAAGLNDLEGFLMVQAEYQAAEREARAFTDRMPWLTTAQQEEVARQYVAERIRLNQRALSTIVGRTRALRGEYEARYAFLRARLLKRFGVAVCTVLMCTAGITAWVARWTTGD
ncbi:hypothetical protein ACWERY_19180 [Streptomyces sp. NPDC004082]